MASVVKANVHAALVEAQASFAAHQNANKVLFRAFSENSVTFLEHTFHALNRVLVIYARDSTVERLVYFFAQFAVASANFRAVHPTGRDSEASICTALMNYLIHHTNASSKAVRFRSTQLLSTIICLLPEESEVEERLWGPLVACLNARATDLVPRVRTAAIPGLCRLQEALDGDEIRHTLWRLLEGDTSPTVRKAVVSNIILDAENLARVLTRVTDESEDVRRSAFKTLAEKVDPVNLSISERVKLLEKGSRDRSVAIRRDFMLHLVRKGWLEGSCRGDVLRFCALLDPETYLDQIVPVLSHVMNVHEKLKHPTVDLNELDENSAAYIVALSKSKGGSQQLETIFPTVLTFVETLTYYKRDEFVVRCLLDVCEKLDLSDESGRRELTTVLRTDFLDDDATAEALFVPILRALNCSVGAFDSLAELVTELLVCPHDGPRSDDGLSRALLVIKALLEVSPRCEQPQAYFSSMMETIALPALTSSVDEIRGTAISCLGRYCLLDVTDALVCEYAVIFLQAGENDVLDLRLLALNAISDFLMLYSFNDSGPDQKPRKHALVKFLCGYLSSAESDLRTAAAESIAKLLFCFRLPTEPALLARLLLLLFNPVTVDDNRLRQCLSVFFPALVLAHPNMKVVLEECFLNVIDVLMEAPATSPLSQVDPLQPARFMLELTVSDFTNRRTVIGEAVSDAVELAHCRLGMGILNRLLNEESAGENSKFARCAPAILNSLVLPTGEHGVSNMEELVSLAAKAVSFSVDLNLNRQTIQGLKKFHERLIAAPVALRAATPKEEGGRSSKKQAAGRRALTEITNSDLGIDCLVTETENLRL